MQGLDWTQPGWRSARRALVLLAAAATIWSGFVLAFRQIGPQQGSATIAIVAMTPYMVLLSGLGAIAAGVARKPLWTVAASVVFLTAFATQLSLAIPSSIAEPTPEDSFRILTANVDGDRGDTSVLIEQIAATDPDVVALEALGPDQIDRLAQSGLDERLPYQHVELGPRLSGTGVWSRYPLDPAQAPTGFTWPQIVVGLDTPQLGRITVVAVHTISPRPGLSGIWAREHERLNDFLGSLPGLVIAAGDFNATLDHRVMQNLGSEGYEDAADQIGQGMLRTWPATRPPFPLLGIDHVLVRGPAAASRGQVLGPIGSDHLPLVVALARTD